MKKGSTNPDKADVYTQIIKDINFRLSATFVVQIILSVSMIAFVIVGIILEISLFSKAAPAIQNVGKFTLDLDMTEVLTSLFLMVNLIIILMMFRYVTKLSFVLYNQKYIIMLVHEKKNDELLKLAFQKDVSFDKIDFSNKTIS